MYERELIELIGGTVVLVLGGWWLRHLLRFPGQMTLFDICVAGNVLFAGSGPWLAFIYGKGSLPDENEILVLTTFAIILMYIATIVSIGYLTHHELSRSDHASNRRTECTIASLSALYKKISLPLVLFVVLGVWTVRVIAGVAYGVWFPGSGADENGVTRLPYAFFIVYGLASALASGCLLWSSRVFWTRARSRDWQIALILMTLELTWAFVMGRRAMLGWFIFMGVGYFTSGNRLKVSHTVIAVLLLICFAMFFFPLFHRVRYYHNYLPPSQEQNAVSRFAMATGMALTESGGYTEDDYNENMAERPLIHRFICRIKEQQDTHELMKGEAFLTSVLKVIPSIFLPNKRDMLDTEEYIEEWYDLRNIDTSITWPSVGCADFGLFGGVVAGLLMGGSIWLSEFLARSIARSMPFVSLCVIGTMIDTLYHFEADPTSTLVALRAVLILIFGGWIFRFFLQKEMRRW